jgi:ABC-type transporter Mla subunit MlaD
MSVEPVMKLLNRIFKTADELAKPVKNDPVSEVSETEDLTSHIFSEDEVRFYRALQLVSSQTAQLSRQIFRALEVQENFLSEISQRTGKLDAELKMANDYLNSSNSTVGALQAQIDVEVNEVNTAVGQAMDQILHRWPKSHTM